MLDPVDLHHGRHLGEEVGLGFGGADDLDVGARVVVLDRVGVLHLRTQGERTCVREGGGVLYYDYYY